MNLEKDFAVVNKQEFDSFKGDYTTSKGFRKILSALSHYEEFMGMQSLAEEKARELYTLYLNTRIFKTWFAEDRRNYMVRVTPDVLMEKTFSCDKYLYTSLRNTIRNGEQWIISSDSCTFINEWSNKDMVKLRNTLKEFLES